MYCTTCSSLAPRCSCSRISRRRSSARPACESAMVWFWHTRQRSSAATRSMRASSAGSAAAGSASLARASTEASASATMSRTLTIELPQQRHDLRLDHALRQRSDVLEANHALLVDHERLRHAVDAEVDADATVVVRQRDGVGVAELLQPAACVVALVLVVQAHQRRQLGARQRQHLRMLFPAGA